MYFDYNYYNLFSNYMDYHYFIIISFYNVKRILDNGNCYLMKKKLRIVKNNFKN